MSGMFSVELIIQLTKSSLVKEYYKSGFDLLSRRKNNLYLT